MASSSCAWSTSSTPPGTTPVALAASSTHSIPSSACQVLSISTGSRPTPISRSADRNASTMTPSAAMPLMTPTKFGSVSSTIPLTFGVTATGSCQSSTHCRSRPALRESMPRPTSTIGRDAAAHRARRSAARAAGSAIGRAGSGSTIAPLGRISLTASRADRVTNDAP